MRNSPLGIAGITLASLLLLSSSLRAECKHGDLPGGALYEICLPDSWNGDLIVYAHGYVSPMQDPALPEDSLEGVPVSAIVNALGYGYATTSYRRTGLAVPEAVADLVELVAEFDKLHAGLGHTFLVGVSEGGWITTLAVEQHPEVFSGGLAACGPVGDFRKQINYFGDFFVVFNYFFPGLIPASPESVPQYVIEDWESLYEPAVEVAVVSQPWKTKQLLKVTGAPIDPDDPASVVETVTGILWYGVFATNDAKSKLGGQPFDNTWRWYRGSANDWRLNRYVERIRADHAALDNIEQRYQTSGALERPLVTMHTTGDPIIPYWHEPLYRIKAFWSGSGLLHSNLPVFRYGHCNFTIKELLGGFALLVLKVTGRELLGN